MYGWKHTFLKKNKASYDTDSILVLVYFMILSDGSYKCRKRRLRLEVENKSATPHSSKRLAKIQSMLESTFVPFFLPPACLDLREYLRRKGFVLTGEEVQSMDTQLLFEEKHILLKNQLGENLQKKHALELRINKQFEELKKLEISLEKRACITAAEE